MNSKAITLESLREEEGTTEQLMRGLYQSQGEVDQLQLTGLELLGFLAVKVVIPIACSLVGRILYDKYKDLQTDSQAQKAREEIVSSQNLAYEGEPVGEQLVIQEVSAILVSEGISKEHAQRIVSESYNRIRGKYAA